MKKTTCIFMLTMGYCLAVNLSNRALAQPTQPSCGTIKILEPTTIDTRFFSSGSYQLNVNGTSCADVLGIDGALGQILGTAPNAPLPTPWVSLFDAIGAPKFTAGSTIGIRLQKLQDLPAVRVLEEVVLSGITTSNGSATSASFAMSAAAVDSTITSQSFSNGDSIDIVSRITPQIQDRGLPGDIYIVVRIIENGVIQFFSLNRIGQWEVWDGAEGTLKPAYTLAVLGTEHKISVYSGPLNAGDKAIYMGYSAINGNKRLIHYNGNPFIISVGD